MTSTIAEGGGEAASEIGYDQRLLGPLVSPSFDPATLAGFDFLLGGATAAEHSRDAVADAYLRHELVRFERAGAPLVPVTTSGDGHCLCHAASRASVGSECFFYAPWQPLKR